jgi:hypothetical protein
VLLRKTSSRLPARINAKIALGVWSMALAEGQEPPQLPHWMHISKRETPAVFEVTSARRRAPASATSGGET